MNMIIITNIPTMPLLIIALASSSASTFPVPSIFLKPPLINIKKARKPKIASASLMALTAIPTEDPSDIDDPPRSRLKSSWASAPIEQGINTGIR